MTDPTGSAPSSPRLRLAEMDGATRGHAINLARKIWDRPTSADYLRWRYEDCPTQQAELALAGNECVATIFALRRHYHTTDGVRECLEPFEWHANEEWRASGTGLRVVKRLMAGARPLLALGGTEVATRIFARLGWTPLCVAGTYVLPLRGSFLRARGRSAVTSGLFEWIARRYFTPHVRPDSGVILRSVRVLGPAVMEIARRQQRFAWMRVPDAPTLGWLAAAPQVVGRYDLFEVEIDGETVGWVSVRRHFSGVQRGDIQELFLSDEARTRYPSVLHAVCVKLSQEGVDMIGCVTSCPDSIAALRALHFRHDNEDHVFAWIGGAPVEKGPALFNGGHADRAFFPVPTAAESVLIARDEV